jgi:hypothetical protein
MTAASVTGPGKNGGHPLTKEELEDVVRHHLKGWRNRDDQVIVSLCCSGHESCLLGKGQIQIYAATICPRPPCPPTGVASSSD